MGHKNARCGRTISVTFTGNLCGYDCPAALRRQAATFLQIAAGQTGHDQIFTEGKAEGLHLAALELENTYALLVRLGIIQPPPTLAELRELFNQREDGS